MINLLFSLNENYVFPLKVLIRSITDTNPDEIFCMYLLHTGIRDETLEELRTFVEKEGHVFEPIYNKNYFKSSDKVAITRYYALEMYLWMFAPYILPDHVDRILYLDPDIICLNKLRPLYTKPFHGNSFIATNYKYKTKWVQPFNNLRLRNFESDDYFNSGVVLMNLEKLRKIENADHIVETIRENKPFLILPDQDIFNLIFVNDIKEEDWRVYNMNPKVYEKLRILFPQKYNYSKVEENVVFIHYSGKHKPWDEREKYKYALGRYYFEAEKKVYPGLHKLETSRKGRKR